MICVWNLVSFVMFSLLLSPNFLKKEKAERKKQLRVYSRKFKLKTKIRLIEINELKEWLIANEQENEMLVLK